MDKLIDETLQIFWNDKDECYNRYYYDKDENEFEVCKEIEKIFEESNLKYKYSYNECFENAGYECDMLSIAWVESNGELNMRNIFIEQY